MAKMDMDKTIESRSYCDLEENAFEEGRFSVVALAKLHDNAEKLRHKEAKEKGTSILLNPDSKPNVFDEVIEKVAPSKGKHYAAVNLRNMRAKAMKRLEDYDFEGAAYYLAKAQMVLRLYDMGFDFGGDGFDDDMP